MRKEVLIAIIVAAVLVVGGVVAVVIVNNSNSSETADTIVGYTFEYRVVGNYGENTISGIQDVSILSEKDNRYEVKTERNVYIDSSSGSRTVLWNDVNTVWKKITDITQPGTFSEEYELNTYWGVKNSKVYTSTVDSVKTTSYVLYDKISFETVVEDGDNLYIYMMDNTDFMKESKSVTPHNYGMSFDITGTAVIKTDPDTKYAMTGSASNERIDVTGTASEYKTSTVLKLNDYTIDDKTETSWELTEESDDYGTVSGTSKISTIWGVLDTTAYVNTKDEQTTTTYVYRDAIPVKLSILTDNELIEQEYAITVTDIVIDGEKIDTLQKLDDFIDKYY